jgi:hypothetical protein
VSVLFFFSSFPLSLFVFSVRLVLVGRKRKRKGLMRSSAMSPKDLTTEGSNVESKVLATAVKWVTEKRVLLNGHKTIVFN